MGFVPMSKRGTPEESKHLALHEGVPDHLRPSIIEWIRGELLVPNEYALDYEEVIPLAKLREIELDLHINLGPQDQMIGTLFGMIVGDPEWCLDLVDYLLQNPARGTANGQNPSTRAGKLAEILTRGSSAWCVISLDSTRCALQRRIDPTVSQAVVEATATNPTAGHHLELAWHLAYSRSPNAGESYRESIKAVEVAAIAIICSAHATATLGSVLGDMRSNIGKWTVEVPATSAGMPDEQLVIAMMNSLWTGQVGRHGSPASAVPATQTLPEAQAAVHLAATLVQWFSSGVIR